MSFPVLYKGGTIMKNKGFSLVELIIVIAIMAILAGALAPALIKYINKARISADIDAGSEMAKAMMEAVTKDAAFEAAVDHNTPYEVNLMDDQDFADEVHQIIGPGPFIGKAKKDVNGDPLDRKFYYTLDYAKNKVEIYYGGTDGDYMIYPTIGSKFEMK